MNRSIITSLAVTALALSGVASAAGSASAATAAPHRFACSLVWHDSNAAGVRCTGSPFNIHVKCKSGQWAQSASVASGQTAYAYCNSIYSSLVVPVQWLPFTNGV